MKIFKTNRVNLAVVTAVVLVGAISCLQSCSKDEATLSVNQNDGLQKIKRVSLESINQDEVINSVEFEEYIESNIELYSAFKKADSILNNSKSLNNYILSNQGKKLYKVQFEFDSKLITNSKANTKRLIDKFPALKNLASADFISVTRKKVMNSNTLQQLLVKRGIGIKKRSNVRQKVSSLEGITTYSTAWEAFLYASIYSDLTQNECSGYVFGDGSAILYINPNATHGSTTYPQPVYNQTLGGFDITIYNGNVVESTFHTHFNSPLFSTPTTTGSNGNDQSVQSNYYPNSSLIILYNGNVYEYPFQYGYYMP